MTPKTAMAQFCLSTLIVLISSRLIPHVVARTLTETIWSSVIVTRNGDSVPLISSSPTVLTPLGAQQLHSAGALFRDRYLHGNSMIPNISRSEIDSTQTFALSVLAEYVETSAQALLQGLYPPDPNTIISPLSLLANGTPISPPLGGYQYPFIRSYSRRDPQAIWLAGHTGCDGYSASASDYFASAEFNATLASAQPLYDSVDSSVFGGELLPGDITYAHAYFLFDYINYGYLHNRTIRAAVTADQLAQFRTLADQWVYAVNGDYSASAFVHNDHIRTIAGQTIATEILGAFFNNYENNGTASMINLLFTTFDPMVSLASLLGLPNLYPQFYGLPEVGSSMVFEMFTASSATATYPTVKDLQVRFLFRNGTENAPLEPYAIFGGSETMTLVAFSTAMANVMIADVGQWCRVCHSRSIFCPFATNTTSGNPPSFATGSPAIKPAVAGVIGAIVALVVAGAVLLAAMVLFGVRFQRVTRSRRGTLGGFKGSEKLASDVDVSVVKAGATVVGKGEGEGAGEGIKEERVGSWELREGRGTRASFERDGDRDGDGDGGSMKGGRPVEVKEVV